MLLAQEIDFVDAKEAGARDARMKALQGEIEELKVEQTAKIEMALTEAKGDLEVQKLRQQMDVMTRETARLDTEHKVAMNRLEEMAKLEIAAAAREEQFKSMRGMQDIELDGKEREENIKNNSLDSAHNRDMDRRRQEDDTALAKMRLQREMSPDQILATQAGLSADVAAVFAERAKTDAAGEQEKMQLMERLIASGAQTADQAKYFFEQFKEGVVGVAAGAGPTGGGTAAAPTIVCPHCRAEVAADAAFCDACGRPTRGPNA
ncbi:MAG: zinc-ribbon domain-containing protein [Pseudomonadota bacterium]